MALFFLYIIMGKAFETCKTQTIFKKSCVFGFTASEVQFKSVAVGWQHSTTEIRLQGQNRNITMAEEGQIWAVDLQRSTATIGQKKL